MRELKFYTYEVCDSYIPSDVNEALLNPSHIRQARMLVVARTAKQAYNNLVDLGLRGWFEKRLPRIAHGNDVDAISRAGLAVEDYVFVVSDQNNNVIRVMFDNSITGHRICCLIGRLTSGPNFTKVFERA